MTLRELLKQNELRVVEVAAGADGLEIEVHDDPPVRTAWRAPYPAQ